MKKGINKVIARVPQRILQVNVKGHNSKNLESVYVRDFTGRPDYTTLNIQTHEQFKNY